MIYFSNNEERELFYEIDFSQQRIESTHIILLIIYEVVSLTSINRDTFLSITNEGTI